MVKQVHTTISRIPLNKPQLIPIGHVSKLVRLITNVINPRKRCMRINLEIVALVTAKPALVIDQVIPTVRRTSNPSL